MNSKWNPRGISLADRCLSEKQWQKLAAWVAQHQEQIAVCPLDYVVKVARKRQLTDADQEGGWHLCPIGQVDHNAIREAAHLAGVILNEADTI